MKTIKLKIMNFIDLDYELRTYNSVVHFAYNRFHDDSSLKEKDVRSQVNQLFKGKLNSWLLQCAIKEGVLICPKCETKNPVVNIFCSKCGHKLKKSESDSKKEKDKKTE